MTVARKKQNNWTTVPVKPIVCVELKKLADERETFVSALVFNALKNTYPDVFTDEMKANM
jgi:hypothetical protein